MKFCLYLVLILSVFAFRFAASSCRYKSITVEVGQRIQPPGECLLFKCEKAYTMTSVCPKYFKKPKPGCVVTYNVDGKSAFPECCYEKPICESQPQSHPFRFAASEYTCGYKDITIRVGQTIQPPGECLLFKCENGVSSLDFCPEMEKHEADCVIGKYIHPTGTFPDCCVRELKCPHLRYDILRLG